MQMQIHVNKNALQKMIFGWITLHLKIFLSFIFDHKQKTGDAQGRGDTLLNFAN